VPGERFSQTVLLRRLLACLLSLLVLIETGGIARALGHASVSCCCGEHARARPCQCKACPVARSQSRAALAARAAIGDRLSASRACTGGDDEAGVLVPLAIAPANVLAVAAPAPAGRLFARPSRPFAERVLEAGRPPP